MKYHIVGQDGARYGPVDAEQIRQWIAQKRVDNRTPIFVEGASDWTYVGLLPEFAANVATPVISPIAPMGSVVALPGSPTNPLAVWGMICGVVSCVCCCCGSPFSLVGLVLSIVALNQIKARPDMQGSRGMAIVGIVLSIVGLLCGLCGVVLNIIGAITNNGANNTNFTWHFGSN